MPGNLPQMFLKLCTSALLTLRPKLCIIALLTLRPKLCSKALLTATICCLVNFNINALQTLSIYCLKNTSIHAAAHTTPGTPTVPQNTSGLIARHSFTWILVW